MRSTVARVVAIVGLAGVGYSGARFVDAGGTLDWPLWARFTMATVLLFAIIGVVAVFHSILSPEHSDLGPELESDRRGPTLRNGLFVGGAVVLLFFACAKVLETYAGIRSERTFLAGFGIGLTWCTLRKPWWFWGHWKAHFLRTIIGDAATTVVYMALAGLALYMALFGSPPSHFR